VSDRLTAILGRLRAAGGRVTPARRAIVAAVLEAHGHVTADDLVERVQAVQPDVHRSTVYRTLDALEQLGVVDHVHLGHGRSVYHLADDPHQHLVCEVCGSVTEMPDAFVDGFARQVADAFGFTVRMHHFAILGRCATCADVS
jgi:Fe2+ or Zn2+ uptake regulation protein